MVMELPSQITAFEKENIPVPPKKKVEPKKRTEFKPCDPYWIRKEFKYLIQHAPKKNQEEYARGLISSCAQGAVKGAAIAVKPKRAMTGWNCYLKTCATEDNGLNFPACMQDKGRKESKYTPKKEEWNERAKQGCLS